ncbi:hypothetical protein TKK_0013719 [Trichogramma kaykai]
MRRANQAILRENHPIPKFESIMTKLLGAKYFSRIDLTDAYHQIELDEDSRYITTFITHKTFEINSAVEIFQKKLEMILMTCKNYFKFPDDIIVFGSEMEKHDVCLKKVLSVLDDKNVSRNETKCKYRVKELSFLGHILSDRGMDSKKIETILSFCSP